ncbi:DinB family protein [Alicyclobacillus fastidiosus]|nr:integrase [Alicyclobacillus fastidiosus]
MSDTNLFKIRDIEGFSPQIGRLVSMMNYVRFTTLSAVQGLSTEQLDYLPDENSNSIGALLLHIAAVELGFQIEIFDGRKPNETEVAKWGAAYGLGEQARKEVKGKPLEFYIEEMTAVRNGTLAEFKERQDDWLTIERQWDGNPSNNHFIWFHVFEDEINHRGQIRILRKRLPF